MTQDLKKALIFLLKFLPSNLDRLVELVNPKINLLPRDITISSLEMEVWAEVWNNQPLMTSIAQMISCSHMCLKPQETVYSNLLDKVSLMRVDLLILSEDLIPSRQVLVANKETLNKEWAFLTMMVFHKERNRISEINLKWLKKYLTQVKV